MYIDPVVTKIITIPENAIVLFQGDSVTDALRDRNDPTSLGTGYVNVVASLYGSIKAAKNPTFLNRGVAGDSTADLLARWQVDCIDIQPNVLTLMVGPNNIWKHPPDQPVSETLRLYNEQYRELMDWTIRDVPGVQIILMESFLYAVDEMTTEWREVLIQMIEIVRQIAVDYGTPILPLDGAFAQARIVQPPLYWTYDGIHPKAPGNGIIAQNWLSTVE